jgi:hypothetical protein
VQHLIGLGRVEVHIGAFKNKELAGEHAVYLLCGSAELEVRLASRNELQLGFDALPYSSEFIIVSFAHT